MVLNCHRLLKQCRRPRTTLDDQPVTDIANLGYQYIPVLLFLRILALKGFVTPILCKRT